MSTIDTILRKLTPDQLQRIERAAAEEQAVEHDELAANLAAHQTTRAAVLGPLEAAEREARRKMETAAAALQSARAAHGTAAGRLTSTRLVWESQGAAIENRCRSTAGPDVAEFEAHWRGWLDRAAAALAAVAEGPRRREVWAEDVTAARAAAARVAAVDDARGIILTAIRAAGEFRLLTNATAARLLAELDEQLRADVQQALGKHARTLPGV